MESLGSPNEYFWGYLGGYQVEKRTKSPISLALQICGHLSTNWNCYSRKGTNTRFLLPPNLQSTLFLARAVFYLTLAETQSHETSF